MTAIEDISVLLLTAPHSRRFASLEGSPLAGRANVTHIDWGDALVIEGTTGVPRIDWKDSTDFGPFDTALAEADALLVAPWTFVPPFSDDRWRETSDLKVIAGTFDNRFEGWLDVAKAIKRGMTVVDTSRSMTPTVAEFSLAMTLNLLRDIPAAIQLVRGGAWKTDFVWDQPGFVHGDLTGRRVGLAGFGTLNRRFAELIAPFNCSVSAYDPFVAPSDMRHASVEHVGSLTDLASESEVFVIGIPPTPATLKIVSKDVINSLPRGAIVILVTRMAVVEQDALWERVERGELRAAVDVFDPEPPPPDASIRFSPYVLPTPHIAGATTEAHRRCFLSACVDALSVLAGETPRYRVSVRDEMIYQGRQKRFV